MGKPSKVEAAKVNDNYNWGAFGSAGSSGVNLSGQANQNVIDAQSGVSQYLNELLNPSYNNASFKAREDLINRSNMQYANEMGAQAIARGARGSATQQILNSLAANRNNDLRNAMTQEDARVRNILASAMGVESNYFGQSQSMADNILQRALANQSAQNAANQINTQAKNQWKNNLFSSGAGILGTIGGAALGSYLAPAATNIVLGGATS